MTSNVRRCRNVLSPTYNVEDANRCRSHSATGSIRTKYERVSLEKHNKHVVDRRGMCAPLCIRCTNIKGPAYLRMSRIAKEQTSSDLGVQSVNSIS